ncbi:MAG: ABC transporter permease [Spirochaetaceae bacterium]|nr:ABC transporter permease [Spirochaetaceae bacterium]
MRTYIIRRLLLTIPTLLLVTMLVFLSIHLIPGDILDLLMSSSVSQASGAEMSSGGVTREWLEQKLGLDVPIHIQYGRWLGNILLHGDLGTTLTTDEPVWETFVRPRIPVSLELGFISLLILLLLAVPIGTYSAIRQNTLGDYVGRGLSILMLSIPEFWIATIVLVFPSIYFGWSPPIEYVRLMENPRQNLIMFLIPAAILGTVHSGPLMRLVRTQMLEVLRQDYVRTAWSKGLQERVVVVRHVLKNGMIPIITLIGLQIPLLIGGAVILEQMFVLPGLGRLIVQSLLGRDYAIVAGAGLVVATTVVVINLAVDLAYGFLDPRIRYG